MNDIYLQSLFSLCADKNKFIYETSGIFGNKLTLEEIQYWWIYNIIQTAKFYNIEYEKYDFESLLECIKKEKTKRAKKLKK